jgi:TetR/AcrR family fatty acid metabolism transcriptional regulator
VRTKTPEQAEKILTAAARLFAGQRFHEARMEDIAAAAEVGKGTLYRYFKDKEELYTALLSRSADHQHERLHAAVNQARGARAKLEAAIAVFISFFDENPHLLDLIQHAEMLHKRADDFPWQRARDESMQLVRTIFQEADAAGEFRVRDPELGMLLLLGGVRAVLRFGTRSRPADLPARLVEMFLAGADEGRAAWPRGRAAAIPR